MIRAAIPHHIIHGVVKSITSFVIEPPAIQSLQPFSEHAVKDIAAHLNPLLADVFALYLKTKNFHWHMFRSHFRDYHLMLDEQGEQIVNITDDIAERIRKIGGTTLHSISDIARLQRLADNDLPAVPPQRTLAELWADNLR